MLLAGPALADEPYDSFMAGVPDCLAKGSETCIGDGAGACIDGAPDGQTTVGMSFCLMAERDAWDVLLNLEYRAARQGLIDIDEADRAYSPEHAVRADLLRDAQRAWIAFRDAECALQYGLYGAGTMRQIVGADCHMRLTAERTFELRALRLQAEGE